MKQLVEYQRIILLFFLLAFCFNYTSQIPNLEALVSKNDKCILKIFTIDEYGELLGQGSGVLIDSKGIGVTNFHVLEGASNAVAVNIKGEKFIIDKIIDFSMTSDLVKFQLENSNSTIFPKVSIFYGKNLKGASVFSIGYPKGFDLMGESTVGPGIISGIRTDEVLPGQGELDSIIQTTVPITHGNSGGGLFDSKGNLIGITQGTFAKNVEDLHANLNRAIPVKHLKLLKRKLNFSFDQFLSECAKTNLFAQGVLAYNNGDYVIAYDLFQEYQKVNEINKLDPKVWYLKGNCAFHLGRKSNRSDILKMALENYSKSLILDSMSVNARSFMALTFEELGEMDYAFEVAKDGFNINPNNAFCNYVLGKLYNVSNNKELAVDYLTKAINLFEEKNTDLESLAQWYLERAIANGWLKNDYNAEQDYKKCISLSDNNISQPLLDGLFWYGNFLAIRNRLSESCLQFNKLKLLQPNYKTGGTTIDEMIEMTDCN
jgi:tetratricopeptide (TPR) repeat protein